MPGPLLPGAYLRLRREAAGVALYAVARGIGGADGYATTLLKLEELEGDRISPIDFDLVLALDGQFDFDPAVFVQLVAVRAGALRPAPDLCRTCGCSWNDPCDPPCSWENSENDHCTACAQKAVVQ